jgi:hypothetical protein
MIDHNSPGKIWAADLPIRQNQAAIGQAAMGYAAQNPIMPIAGMGGPFPAYEPIFSDPIEQLIYNTLKESRGTAGMLAIEIRKQIDMFNLAAAWGLKLAKPVPKVA